VSIISPAPAWRAQARLSVGYPLKFLAMLLPALFALVRPLLR
jgi:hypothetical protein